MKDFAGRLAVVTGGGTGIGRALVVQLAAEGCHVACCDLSADTMQETVALAESARQSDDVRITAHRADVSDEGQLIAFRDDLAAQHCSDCVHLLLNNAGIGAGGSLFTDSRDVWDRTFAICWGGVYLGVRTFLPMLCAADRAHIVNVASINGVWASLGPRVPHTAYVAAKFAVRGFTEALITDLRVNAPHVTCSVAMPGHVGTPILENSRRALSAGAERSSEIDAARKRVRRMGLDPDRYDDEAVLAMVAEQRRRFVEQAPTTPQQAANAILDGVKQGHWRILVGEDAQVIDRMVRDEPDAANEESFYWRLVEATGWSQGR